MSKEHLNSPEKRFLPISPRTDTGILDFWGLVTHRQTCQPEHSFVAPRFRNQITLAYVVLLDLSVQRGTADLQNASHRCTVVAMSFQAIDDRLS
jgi:hypothetical protein